MPPKTPFKNILLFFSILGPSKWKEYNLLLLVSVIMANMFLTGKAETLDLIIKITTWTYFTLYNLSLLFSFWLYATSEQSKSPYKQMAYLLILCALLVLGVFSFALFMKFFITS